MSKVINIVSDCLYKFKVQFLKKLARFVSICMPALATTQVMQLKILTYQHLLRLLRGS